MDALLAEFNQRNEHMRHLFDLVVKWFTWFCTVLIASWSWCIIEGVSLPTAVFLAVFWVSQCVCWIVGLPWVIKSMKEHDRRIGVLLSAAKGNGPELLSPAPTETMVKVLRLLVLVFYMNIAVWVAIVVLQFLGELPTPGGAQGE